MSRHCKECGWHDYEYVDQRGSDVIPVHECQSCGDVAATGCDCDDPLGHRDS